MTTNYVATTGLTWTGPSSPAQGIGLFAGAQGYTLARLEMTLEVNTPASAPTIGTVFFSRGGSPPGTSIPVCPMRDNTVAMSRLLTNPTPEADPNLPAAANSQLATWNLGVGGYSLDFPLGGIWVPPGSGLYLFSGGQNGVAIMFQMYFGE